MRELVTFDFSTFTATDMAQIAAAVGTAAIAVITFAYVLATRAMVNEMRTAREAQQRPYVVLDLDYPRATICDMIIKNVGNGAAVDLRVTFDPDLEYQKSGRKLSELPIFNENRFIVPGRELRFFYGSLTGKSPPTEEQGIKASLEYRDTEGKVYTDEIIVNPYLRRQLYFIEEKTFSDLVKAVERVNRGLKDLRDEAGHLRQSATAEWLASVAPFQHANVSTLRAKLLEVKTLWQEIYAKDEYRNAARFQARFQRLAFEIVGLLSLAQTGEDQPSKDFVTRSAGVAHELYDLGSIRFYMDGGASWDKFNEKGNQLVARIDDILA